MKHHMRISVFILPAILLIVHACTSKQEDKVQPEPAFTTHIDWETVQDSSDMLFSIIGLSNPEAVRYDPDQDVYFISNFNGGGNDEDANGFITKADAEGNIVVLKFMESSGDNSLHAPRGMYLSGNDLWVADVNGVHSFNKNTGNPTGYISFSEFEIGFLNDVVADKEGNIFVTDTGTATVYIIQDGSPSVYIDNLPVSANGITLNPANNDLLLATWGGNTTFYSINKNKEIAEFATMGGAYFDGIEFLEGKVLVSSQQDSSIRVYDEGDSRILIHTPGRGADIGIDTQRSRIAVPYLALNRVDIWSLNKR